MRGTVIVGLAVLLALPACGSRLNPLNWFKRAEPVAQTSQPAAPVQPADPRLLVAQVTALTLDRMPGGVIVRAVGLPPTQGFWEAELVERRDGTDPSILTYDFRVFPPIKPADVSTRQSREVVVATFVSNIKLANLSRIVVQGQGNALATSR